MISVSWIELLILSLIPAIVGAIRGYRHASRRATVPLAGLTSAVWCVVGAYPVSAVLAISIDIARASPDLQHPGSYVVLPAIVGVLFLIVGVIPASANYAIVRRVFDASGTEDQAVKRGMRAVSDTGNPYQPPQA